MLQISFLTTKRVHIYFVTIDFDFNLLKYNFGNTEKKLSR